MRHSRELDHPSRWRPRSFVFGALLLSVVFVSALPSVAEGARVSIKKLGDGPRWLDFDAERGERNRVAATFTGRGYRITDRAARVVAGLGCKQRGRHRVKCFTTKGLSLDLHAGDDRATLRSVRKFALDGGEGDDLIDARRTPARGEDKFIHGSDGDDTLLGGPGSEFIVGEGATDHVDGGGGQDFIHGGGCWEASETVTTR